MGPDLHSQEADTEDFGVTLRTSKGGTAWTQL